MSEIQALVRDLDLHRAGHWWRGRCPICGNRSLSVTQGRLGLRACCHYGCDGGQVRAAIGDGPTTRPNRPESEEKADAQRKATERAVRLWSGAEPVTAGDPAGRYLAGRRIEAAIGNASLRYRVDTRHPSGGRQPALLCRIDGRTGEQIAVHRIYLTRDGRKANLDPVKASLGPVWSGAIRFGDGDEIVVAEGPETALAAGIILGLPAWSSISCGNLARGLILAPNVRRVTIAADHDPVNSKTGKRPGIDAAEAAERRWRTEGRNVRILRPDVEGEDFADILARRRRERV